MLQRAAAIDLERGIDHCVNVSVTCSAVVSSLISVKEGACALAADSHFACR